jgi:hypothetical protein
MTTLVKVLERAMDSPARSSAFLGEGFAINAEISPPVVVVDSLEFVMRISECRLPRIVQRLLMMRHG